MGRRAVEETGNRYGRLTVQRRVDELSHNATWLCLCDCGNTAEVTGTHLRRDQGTRSCGCLKKEQGTAQIRQVAKAQIGAKHPGWKGEEVGYGALHIWLRDNKTKTGTCSRCGEERYTEWANLVDYNSRDPDDYIELCKPCHMRHDGHPWIGREAKLKESA